MAASVNLQGPQGFSAIAKDWADASASLDLVKRTPESLGRRSMSREGKEKRG